MGGRFPGRCSWCRRPMGYYRITIPRARTQDIVMCGWSCVWEWDEDNLLATIVEE